MSSPIAAGNILAGIGLFGLIIYLLLILLYLIFPFVVMFLLLHINDKAATQNKLLRQLLRAYGHEPED